MANTKRTTSRKSRTTARKNTTRKSTARKSNTRKNTTRKSTVRKNTPTTTAKTSKSPFSTSFNNAINRGTPCFTAIENIAKRNGKTTNFVMNSLCKSGDVCRQKFNGQWICWPANVTKKSNATTCKEVQCDMWQCFIDWCICSGQCTPEQLQKHCSSQKEFMSWCKKFWGRQFPKATTTTKRRTTSRSTSRRTSGRKTSTGNYKFPVRRAA